MATPPGNPHQNEATPSGSHHPPATQNSDARPVYIPPQGTHWSAEEQAILEDGLVRYASTKGVERYAKIARHLQNKSVRDVALRCTWMSNKESKKRREIERTRNRDRMENNSSGTPSRLTSQPDTADGISYNGEWQSGSAGIGFSPHVITVAAGEDIASKILSFLQHAPPRAICVLSANGSVSKATLRQPSAPGSAVTYEGRFQIISLSGSFLPTIEGGSPNGSGGLSVSLASLDGHVIGGLVGEMLIAASPVQVCLGSFMWGCTRGKNNKGAGLEHSNRQASQISDAIVTNPASISSSVPNVAMDELARRLLQHMKLNESSSEAKHKNLEEDTREHLSPPSGLQHLSTPSASQRKEHDNVLELSHRLAVEKRRAGKTRLESLLEKIEEEHNQSLSKKINHMVESKGSSKNKEQQ